MVDRVERLNSLLREVISDVIRRQVKNPRVSELVTVTHVSITKDLHYAKVYVSIIGNDEERQVTLKALEESAGFIAVRASKQITIRFFPELRFKLDDSVDKQMRIDALIEEIHRSERHSPDQ